MATLRIPRENEKGLKKLNTLNDDAIRELVSALRDVSPVLSSVGLSSKVASKIDTVPRSDIDEIVGVLLPIYLLRERQEISTPEIAEDVCQAMDRSNDEELRLSGQNRDRFKRHLIELLDVESVRVGAKGLEVLFENQHSFIGARVVTEVRPIFGSNLEDTPTGALIVHMLKLTYQERGQEKDFFIALDATDVSTLRDTLDRADTKANTLKAFLERTRVSYVDPE